MKPHSRLLELSLLVNFVIHGVALLSMAALLLPSLPGGTAPSDLSRVVHIAEAPWLFRLGWLPWQLCAAADIGLAVALLRTTWISRTGASVVAAFTLLAVVPDQYAQIVWITRGVELAQTDHVAYFELEKQLFPLTAGWGALFYTCSGLAWTWCFARAGTWSRALTALSVPLWLVMGVAVVSPLLPADIRPSVGFVSTANGLGFAQLQLWLGLVTWEVHRRRSARPFRDHTGAFRDETAA